MHALGRRFARLAIMVAVAASTVAAVALWGAGTAQSFAIFVASTAAVASVATLLEPVVRASGRGG